MPEAHSSSHAISDMGDNTDGTSSVPACSSASTNWEPLTEDQFNKMSSDLVVPKELESVDWAQEPQPAVPRSELHAHRLASLDAPSSSGLMSGSESTEYIQKSSISAATDSASANRTSGTAPLGDRKNAIDQQAPAFPCGWLDDKPSWACETSYTSLNGLLVHEVRTHNAHRCLLYVPDLSGLCTSKHATKQDLEKHRAKKHILCQGAMLSGKHCDHTFPSARSFRAHVRHIHELQRCDVTRQWSSNSK